MSSDADQAFSKFSIFPVQFPVSSCGLIHADKIKKATAPLHRSSFSSPAEECVGSPHVSRCRHSYL